MERFGPALRRTAEQLDLPRRIRTELLLEMAADLEAVYEHYRARGLPEGEAARRAEATVLGSSEVIRRLGRLHESPLCGWAREVGARLSGGLEVVLLVVGVLPILGLGGVVSIWALAANTSPLTWLLLLVGSLMATRLAVEARHLLRGRPLRRDRLPSLLVLSAMAPAIGSLAATLGLQRAASGLAGETSVQAILSTVAVRDGATLLAGLLLGIGGLLSWFFLLEREMRRGERELDALLADDGSSPEPPGAADDTDTVIPLVRRRHG